MRPTPPTLAKSLQPAIIEQWEPDQDFLDTIPELFPDDSGNDGPAKASEPTAAEMLGEGNEEAHNRSIPCYHPWEAEDRG